MTDQTHAVIRPEASDTAAPVAPAWDEGQRPAVAATGKPRDIWLISGAAVLMGLVTVLWLGARRSADAAETHVATPTGYAASPAIPAEVANYGAPRPLANAGVSIPIPTIATQATAVPLSFSNTPTTSDANVAAQANLQARLKSPALVIDLGDQAQTTAQAAGAPAVGDAPARTVDAGSPAGASGLNGDEQFAHRVGAQEPDRAEASRIDNLRDTIPQGAMIPGVMETALDSDLPGYTRAVVSRDVRGFDGTAVLIPRGSRVIGEYKNAPAEGQSRAFIVWTRIIRPDGVSIQIASSGTDPLGRAGLAGSVNRHLLQRYGGAILLSVIDAGITSLSSQPSTQIVFGSATGATGTAVQPSNISPTIKVPQGSPIRIFVARDLDFSSAERLAR